MWLGIACDTPGAVLASDARMRDSVGMPVPPGTRQRYNPNPAGGRTPGVPRRIGVTVRLELTEHEKLHAAAEALGTTLSVVMSELVRRLELDENGLPSWATAPATQAHQEQLIA